MLFSIGFVLFIFGLIMLNIFPVSKYKFNWKDYLSTHPIAIGLVLMSISAVWTICVAAWEHLP